MSEPDLTMKILREKAENGDVESQFNLGIQYQDGKGVEQNFKEAVKWYRKAAEQGDADAQNNLGFMYEKGLGVERDFDEATKWFHKAAEQGDSDAQFNLGEHYEKGLGVERDFDEATKWYRKASEQGDIEAQKRLENLIISQVESSNEPFIPDGYKEILWPKNHRRKCYRMAFYGTFPLAMFFLWAKGYSFQTIATLIFSFFLKYKSEKV